MDPNLTRRTVLAGAAAGFAASVSQAAPAAGQPAARKGTQRLSLEQLQRWEALGYGMFIHFGMSTFSGKEIGTGQDPPSLYNPDRLDVDQWVSVARDAGMKYIVLTAKHVAGHCLWPSKHTAYSVAKSANTIDVMERFVESCRKRGILPGFYYCSWDNHHRFGSRTPSDPGVTWCAGKYDYLALQQTAATQPAGKLPSLVSSLYQDFQTAQVEELIGRYGPFAEVWIDIPGILGRGYRTFLYRRIAELQPESVIMMNSGIGSGETYPVDYAWPSDIIAIEREMPPGSGHQRWRTIEGAEYYMPGEICDPIGKNWFFVEGDTPRPLAKLTEQLVNAGKLGVNLLLDVPPDQHGVIPDMHVKALNALRKEAGL